MFHSKRYVYEVYREMSFSRAAKNLYISQPSLSAAVKKEEMELGFPIFDRSANPIQLTELGREYIRSVEMIMNIEKGFETYINDLGELKSGSLTIGGSNYYISYVLPPLLRYFIAQYPLIHVNLIESSTADLVDKLDAGSLDLLLDNRTLDPEIYSRKILQEERLLMAVPATFSSNQQTKSYALTAADVKAGLHLNTHTAPVPMHYFKDDPFLLLREGNDTRERAANICHANHFAPFIKLELDQQATAYNLSCYGLGISFLGDSLVQNVPETDRLFFYKLDSQSSIREVSFYFKRNRYMSKVVRIFLDMVEQEIY